MLKNKICKLHLLVFYTVQTSLHGWVENSFVDTTNHEIIVLIFQERIFVISHVKKMKNFRNKQLEN